MDYVLYRKYRPDSFSQVIGQNQVTSILIESVMKDNISHAYLFAGPRGTGKTSIARLMAKAINCLNFEKENDVCNKCENCKLINAGSSVDIIEMDAASNRGIEEIRDLKDSINFVPTSLKYKVYIIDEVHMLTREAFNALLKTLEEPPEHVKFILATTEPHKLPLTILSRVQRFDFRLGTKKEVLEKLKYIVREEKIDFEEGVLDLIYNQSGGSFRDSESLLSKVVLGTNEDKVTLERIYDLLGIISDEIIEKFISLFVENKVLKIIDLVRKMKVNGVTVTILIDQVLENLRNKLINNLKEQNSKEVFVYKKLIALFIQIKRDIKQFNDDFMLLEISILNNLDFGTSKIKQSKNNQSRKLISKKKEIGNENHDPNVKKRKGNVENLTQKAEKKEDGGVKDFNTVIDKVINSFSNPRLKAILSSSNVVLEKNKIFVYNKYKFHLDLLEKDGKQNLVEGFEQYITNLEGIEFVEKTEDDGHNSEVVSDDEASQAEFVAEPQQEYNASSSGSENSGGEEVEDNSDIVENIL